MNALVGQEAKAVGSTALINFAKKCKLRFGLVVIDEQHKRVGSWVRNSRLGQELVGAARMVGHSRCRGCWTSKFSI